MIRKNIIKGVVFLFVGLVIGCKGSNVQQKLNEVKNYVVHINLEESKEMLYHFASDEFEGRETGEPGQKLAAEYLKTFYQDLGIPSPIAKGDYFQPVPSAYFDGRIKDSENVMAVIEGSKYPNEVIVVSAHYDHLGMNENGDIYNGADDDGSGTIAVMQMAKAMKKAVDEGKGPLRTVLFLHFTGEEKGLLGSRYYVNHPVLPLENTIANLNIDMIGRVDEAHEHKPEYIYLIGSNRLSTQLDDVVQSQNKNYTNLDLDYKYNDSNDPNRLYYRSDHYNFAKNNIPVIFFFSGLHKDYHRPTDTAEKIDYELMQKRTKLVFYTLWDLANRANAIKVDVEG